MRFVEGGPDIPDALIAAQERGELVFLCGAGVSKTAGLPTFRELVEKVYLALHESWEGHPAEESVMSPSAVHAGQYDRALLALERRIAHHAKGVSAERQRVALRHAATSPLAVPPKARLENHEALVALSRDASGRSRIVTTNFDTLFERAWLKHCRSKPASFAGAAMPQPGSPLFEGIFHIHGRVADAHRQLQLVETDLILTSAEFGDAYLRSGWAARYVYDLARSSVIVLVGYQAEDPPMRYLLEVLDADRQRFPELRAIYALAPFNALDRMGELWNAKGIIPVIYGTEQGVDHGDCYASLREWRRYADDPTRWRAARLTAVTTSNPAADNASAIAEVMTLLGHGDATAILAKANPGAPWIEPLATRGVLQNEGARPGPWLEQRLADEEVISACANTVWFDVNSTWILDRALTQAGESLSPVLTRAWRTLLYSQPASARTHEPWERWYQIEARVKAGESGHQVRRAVLMAVVPRPQLSKPYRFGTDAKRPAKRLESLLRVDYHVTRHLSAGDILAAWPQEIDAEAGLLQALTHALSECLDEAQELAFVAEFDRSSSDVPSVSRHPQNDPGDGFMLIVRLMADLWERLAARCPESARRIVRRWDEESMLLFVRLGLHAKCNATCFLPSEVTTALSTLSDQTFWISDAKREINRLCVERWGSLSDDDRKLIESRICVGPPRDMFPDGAFEDKEWSSLVDDRRFRRLRRIMDAGGQLSASSQAVLAEIAARHPVEVTGSGERDDFNSWMEMRHGPQGDPKTLETIPVGDLVDVGVRLNRDHNLNSEQAWELYCQSDPLRALSGLRAQAQNENWNAWAWRAFVWGTTNTEVTEAVLQASALIATMPDACLRPLTHSIASWLRTVDRNKHFRGSESDDVFFRVWDRVAAACLEASASLDGEVITSGDVVTRSLNEDGGILADALIARMWAKQPRPNGEFSAPFQSRFDRLVTGSGRAGTLARVRLAWDTRLLYQVDPAWTRNKLLPLFDWSHKEAQLLWRARANDRHFVGPPELFNALKAPFIEAFSRNADDQTLRGLVEQLLHVALWRRRPKDDAYALEPREVKRALSVAPGSVRHVAAHRFFDWLRSEDDVATSSSERWRSDVGPLFREVWPRDVHARDAETTKRFAWMALEADDAFPEVVDAILDFLVPLDLHFLRIELRQDGAGHGVAARHPKAFIRLLDALIDVKSSRLPEDLGDALDRCAAGDKAVHSMPEFRRLDAAWKKKAR
ncbi:MAG: hypothetical protein C0511_06265 [Hyphomicrobium sp.]|nr:hypothetical protein [Hyphomicrobium sp.]